MEDALVSSQQARPSVALASYLGPFPLADFIQRHVVPLIARSSLQIFTLPKALVAIGNLRVTVNLGRDLAAFGSTFPKWQSDFHADTSAQSR